MNKLFILPILLFYLLFIGGKCKVEENGKELFFIFLEENSIFGRKWLLNDRLKNGKRF